MIFLHRRRPFRDGYVFLDLVLVVPLVTLRWRLILVLEWYFHSFHEGATPESDEKNDSDERIGGCSLDWCTDKRSLSPKQQEEEEGIRTP
jgi:hypothetical protein